MIKPWEWAGTVYVAFVVDTFSRRIVGWSAATTKHTELVLAAVEMGLWQRDREGSRHQHGQLVHHSDAGSQGGFNWWSQHLVFVEVLDGASSAGSGPGAASEAEVSGASEVSASCRGGVLDGDRQGSSA
ncbi:MULTISPECIES: DDE-type integrase/transposase/recombinase [unclassified Streptomyces]|uniref:DDE-type integrase/transposase/recombinase n=1 Tax=unclassified Streptomyces TaxID=2593676 RepID=UPI00386F1537